MKNLRIYCFFCVFMLLACLSASNAFAQGSSFKDVEKMRKEEEKNRAKLAQKNAKDKPQKTSTSPTNEDNTWQNDKKGKGKAPAPTKRGKTKTKKYKKGVPKAAQSLSNQRQNVGKNTHKYRTGDRGLTKAAKGQRKDSKRRKRSEIEVW